MKWYFTGQWTDGAGRPVKVAPIQVTQSARSIPLEVAAEAWKEYAAQGHGRQSLERLCERGGFGASEMAILLYERIKRIESTRMETFAGQPGFPAESPEQERSMRRDRYPPRFDSETPAAPVCRFCQLIPCICVTSPETGVCNCGPNAACSVCAGLKASTTANR